jgi:hypothetical protein
VHPARDRSLDLARALGARAAGSGSAGFAAGACLVGVFRVNTVGREWSVSESSCLASRAGKVTVAALLLATACASVASGSPPSAEGLRFSVVGQIGGPVRAVAADATTAWVGEGIGLSRIDLANPDAVVADAHLSLGAGSDVWSLAWHDRFVFAGTTSGVHVVEGRAPAMREVAFLPTAGRVRAITVFAPEETARVWLFVTDVLDGVKYVEVTASGALLPVAMVTSLGGATAAVAVDGAYAVVPGDGVRILDLSTPTLPVEVARVATSGSVRGVAAGGGVAYLSDSVDGLVVLPLDSRLVPTTRVPGIAGGRIYLCGSNLFVVESPTTGTSMVRLIDVSDPLRPLLVPVDEGAYAALAGAQDLAMVGARLLAARVSALTVADLSDRYRPKVRTEYEVAWPIRQLSERADCVFAVKGAAGLDFVDATRPDAATIALGWRPPGGVSGVLVHDGYAFVSMTDGMARLDVDMPCAPLPLEMPFAPGWPATRWIAAGGRRLAATSAEELDLAEIQGAETPRVLGRSRYDAMPGWPADTVAQGIALFEGPVAYVAAGDAGLVVLNLINPLQPVVNRVLRAPEGLTVRVVVVQGRLLAVGTAAGLLLYELGDPLAPRLVGAALSSDAIIDVALAGDRLYAAADLAGLLVYDVADPSRPSLVGAVQPPYPVTSVVAGDRHVFAAASGLLILDEVSVTPPVSPHPTTATSTPLPEVPTATPTPPPSPTPSATTTLEPTPTPTPPWACCSCMVPMAWR